jgi:putative two-component system response regulator
MIVDDEPINVKVVRKFLESTGYRNFVTTNDATQALAMIEEHQPDVLLLDIMMPQVSGLDILKLLHAQNSPLPVIVLTAVDDQRIRQQALDLGASDFLTKPIDVTDLIPRVRNVLAAKAYREHLQNYAKELEQQVTERTRQLERSRHELILCLGRAGEYRDNETGNHVMRVGCYVGLIARALGVDEARAQLMEEAAPLHDVGKIGIPDAILLKPGKLDPDEFEIMQQHTGYGKDIVGRLTEMDMHALRRHTALGSSIRDVSSSPVLRIASIIALTHHEKWDGSGYPLGLAGEHIPLEGRITAVADVFDALSCKRPYKAAFPLEKCFAILEEGRGKHFDPAVLDAFLKCRDEIVKVQIALADV